MTRHTEQIRRHNLPDILNFADHIAQLDHHHNSTPDGYPTKTPGAATPTPTGHITTCNEPLGHPTGHHCANTRPCPQHDNLTTVEQAAHNRTRRQRDPIHDLAQQAARATRSIAQQLDHLERIRQNVERIQGRTVTTDNTDQFCRLHLQHQQLEDRYRGDLCRRCDTFRLTHGYLPTAPIIDAGERHGWTKIPTNLIHNQRPPGNKKRRKR